MFDVELHRSQAIRPGAQHRRRHDLPAQRLRHDKGSYLALAERAIRKIPQGTLAPLRFVHGQQGTLVVRDGHEVGIVGTPRQQTMFFLDHPPV